MSDIGIPLEKRTHRAESQKKRGPGCLVALVVTAVVIAVGYFAISAGASRIAEMLDGSEDYAGQGTGQVVVEIKEGDSVAAIGRTLRADGVIASVDAFLEVASADESAQSVQPGFYALREKMSAEWALREITDPANKVEDTVTVPEGSRVGEVVELITKSTDISESAVTKVLDQPARLGLPAEAGDNPEGYLFPATYTVAPGTSAEDLLRQMVDETEEIEQKLDVATRAEALGITPEEALTVASIVEYEASREQDLAKVARVIYNRLDEGMPLQMDSTVAYVSKREGDVWTTDAERSSDSAYNTYEQTGLPPGPIGSPGEKTLDAALNPADGPWVYFVTVNFSSGKTLFTQSYQQHLSNVAASRQYCTTSDLC